jgi:Fe-S-cluster containining protein
MSSLENLPKLAKLAKSSSLEFYKKNKKRLTGMDLIVHELHHRISEKTDCLSCANCCKSLGPLVTDKDIEKMAKALRIKPSEVAEKYLRKDEDDDYIFQYMPCPFLMYDNYCMIYESRPKACKEYPHTDRKKFYQIFELSIKNTFSCPIVYDVMEELKKK